MTRREQLQHRAKRWTKPTFLLEKSFNRTLIIAWRLDDFLSECLSFIWNNIALAGTSWQGVATIFPEYIWCFLRNRITLRKCVTLIFRIITNTNNRSNFTRGWFLRNFAFWEKLPYNRVQKIIVIAHEHKQYFFLRFRRVEWLVDEDFGRITPIFCWARSTFWLSWHRF